MRKRQFHSVPCDRRMKRGRLQSPIAMTTFFVLLELLLAISSAASELKQKTIEAFDHYVRVTDTRMQAELRAAGPFLWLDSIPEPLRKELYDRVRRGQLEIRQERTEEDGKPIDVPDGLIHHWVGVVFVPGASVARALTLLQDYDNHWRTYKPDVRRSQLLEHTDDTFRIYLQFYKESPRRVSFNTEFEVHYTQLDATRAISRASSLKIAELEHPEQPDSSEFPVGQGHGYLWRLNNYWRLEGRDGGVYMQVETIALSREVPAIFAWLVNPLIRRVSRQSVATVLNATRRGLAPADRTKQLEPHARCRCACGAAQRRRAFGHEPNARAISSYFFLENIGFSQISYRLFARESASTYYALKAVKNRCPQIAE